MNGRRICRLSLSSNPDSSHPWCSFCNRLHMTAKMILQPRVLRSNCPPGSLPAARDSELMMGMKMPPARAVVDGMAGAISVSAALSPYARPSVLFPKSFTNMVATLSPSPVFWKPCQSAATLLLLGSCISHGFEMQTKRLAAKAFSHARSLLIELQKTLLGVHVRSNLLYRLQFWLP